MLFGMRRMSRCCIKVTKFWPGPGGGIFEYYAGDMGSERIQ